MHLRVVSFKRFIKISDRLFQIINVEFLRLRKIIVSMFNKLGEWLVTFDFVEMVLDRFYVFLDF